MSQVDLDLLKESIHSFKDHRTRENLGQVLDSIQELLSSGSQVLVPAPGDAVSPYRVLTAPDGQRLQVCYTSARDAAEGQEPGPLTRMALGDFFYAVSKQDQLDGLVINPYSSDDFVLNQELVRGMVDLMRPSER